MCLSNKLSRSFLSIACFLPVPLVHAFTVDAFQTSRAGDRLRPIAPLPATPAQIDYTITVHPDQPRQTVRGFGASFTESGGQVLAELSAPRQQELLHKVFSPDEAGFSLTRTHIASCDFSLRNYTYAPVPGDTDLQHFSIEPDRTYLLPFIHKAMDVDDADFQILASPWTAPPWMKSNQSYNGGELLPGHYPTFADYIVRYLEAYAGEGVPIFGITPINEPLGNDSNWESTHFSPEQMARFIGDHLGPALRKAGHSTEIWVYDQNREPEMLEWARTLYNDPEAAPFIEGMAVHWYQSTRDIGAPYLDTVANEFPQYPIIHSEGCIDALGDDEPIGAWLEDDWYWRPEATDWGFFWAAPEDQENHPPYRPFRRYTRDLIEGLNHHLAGWIDWNLILNTRGGPNHARNYCLAPIIVDSGTDSIYYTPLFYSIAHFSKFIRPGAQRLDLTAPEDPFMATACRNPDGSIVVVTYNPSPEAAYYSVQLPDSSASFRIPPQSLQSIVFSPDPK